jgi:hypothetical protein
VRSKKAPEGFSIPMEPSYGHLLEIPFHGLLQLNTLWKKYRGAISATFSGSGLNP